ncbi:MAG: polymer-forming cytoskeletal protein [Bdellovibrionota bacterium]
MTMWKKPEATIGVENEGPTETGLRDPIERPASEAKALLGGSLTFEGTITGAEDLTIEGTVKGIVDLKKHNVVIGKRGRIEGDVFARVISIEGEVLGNVFAGERASIHKSGMVKGNVAAPRVLVEDGARLKGSIDVDSGSAKTEIREGGERGSDKGGHKKETSLVVANGTANSLM